MDIQIPEMDGFEATRTIRNSQKPGLKELPIVAMTAHALAGDREKSLAAGMNDHITKPIDPGLLISTLCKWIKPAEKASALAGISIEQGLERVGGNRELFFRLLSKFYNNGPHFFMLIKYPYI